MNLTPEQRERYLKERKALGEYPDDGTDAEKLAWYHRTFDDATATDDLVLARLYAWDAGQSVGPFTQGVPLR